MLTLNGYNYVHYSFLCDLARWENLKALNFNPFEVVSNYEVNGNYWVMITRRDIEYKLGIGRSLDPDDVLVPCNQNEAIGYETGRWDYKYGEFYTRGEGGKTRNTFMCPEKFKTGLTWGEIEEACLKYRSVAAEYFDSQQDDGELFFEAYSEIRHYRYSDFYQMEV